MPDIMATFSVSVAFSITLATVASISLSERCLEEGLLIIGRVPSRIFDAHHVKVSTSVKDDIVTVFNLSDARD